METMSLSSSHSVFQESANYDELSMQQSLLFSDSLKDLKNLRSQLYSAAEYFELSYNNDDQKQIVVDTLKDYAIKALVNTVDHLGSVTYKVNGLLDEKVDEVSGTELRVSCIEQRLRSCQEHIDREGFSQQSLVILTPKYHKRYILPVGQSMRGSVDNATKYQGCNLEDEDNWHHLKNSIRATMRETPQSSVRKGHSSSPSPRPFLQPGTFSFSEKRTVSPNHASFPLLRSRSRSSSSTTPVSSGPAAPNAKRQTQHPSGLQKSASMRLHNERDNPKEIDQYPSKSKHLLKALLTRRKSKKDDMLYTFLNEY